MINSYKSIFSVKSFENKPIIFDLDGTLLFGDIGETVFFTLLIVKGLEVDNIYEFDIFENIYKKSEINIYRNPFLSNILKKYNHCINSQKMKEAYCLTAKFLEDFDSEEIYSLVDMILKSGLQETKINLNIGNDKYNLKFHAINDPLLSSIIKKCYTKEAKILIISASPQSIVEGYCKFLGLPIFIAKGAICKDKNNKFVPYGMDKMQVLHDEGINHPYIVFGNSEGDFEMLDAGKYSFVRKTNNEQIQSKVDEGKWIYID
jgi:phosphoserine phosphatase